MQEVIKNKITDFLRWSERYTGTDMVYAMKGGFWWILGKGGLAIISIGLLVAFSRLAPKEVFGTYQYIIATAGLLAIFTLPGMDWALTRAIAKDKEGEFEKIAKEKIKWGSLAALGLFLISGWYFINGNNILGISFVIAGLIVPFLRTVEIFRFLWHGRAQFRKLSLLEILGNGLPIAIVIAVLFFTDNIIYIILSWFAANTFFKGLLYLYSRKKIKNQEEDRETIPFGKHMTLIQAFGLGANQLDKIILWHFLGPVAVAVYSFAQLPVQKLQEFIPIAPLALPKLSQKNVAEIKKPLLAKFRKLFLITTPAVLILILIAPLFYKVLFPQYLESVIYFQVLALGLLFIPVSLLGTALITELKTKELYKIRIISPAVRILLYFILIPFLGLWGAVIAFLAEQIINSALVFYYFKKI